MDTYYFNVYFVERPNMGRQMVAVTESALDNPEKTLDKIQKTLSEQVGEYTLGYQKTPALPVILDPATFEYKDTNENNTSSW